MGQIQSASGAVKIHTLIDVRTSIPCFVHITPGAIHDIKGLDVLEYENGGFYVLDRGYFDFRRLFIIHSNGAFFVTRPRKNFVFNRVESRKVKKTKGILVDQTITLSSFYSLQGYPIALRRIKFYDKDTQKQFIFITNNFALPAESIALLYKYRWKIELFFKWIKQHLKVKSFWGTSANAVRIQIYTAIITYALIVVIKSKLKCTLSNYEVLQILSISLLDKEHLKDLLSKSVNQDVKERSFNQLKFDLF